MSIMITAYFNWLFADTFRLRVKKKIIMEPMIPNAMLGGSIFTTAWRVLRLRMEETPSSYGGQLRIY
jgi:hypothetical protein